MFFLDLRKNKSKDGHFEMQNPIMLCLKAKGIHIAPPGNPYKYYNILNYINLTLDLKNGV